MKDYNEVFIGEEHWRGGTCGHGDDHPVEGVGDGVVLRLLLLSLDEVAQRGEEEAGDADEENLEEEEEEVEEEEMEEEEVEEEEVEEEGHQQAELLVAVLQGEGDGLEAGGVPGPR